MSESSGPRSGEQGDTGPEPRAQPQRSVPGPQKLWGKRHFLVWPLLPGSAKPNWPYPDKSIRRIIFIFPRYGTNMCQEKVTLLPPCALLGCNPVMGPGGTAKEACCGFTWAKSAGCGLRCSLGQMEPSCSSQLGPLPHWDLAWHAPLELRKVLRVLTESRRKK